MGFHVLTELSCPPDMPVDRVLHAAPALRFVGKLYVQREGHYKNFSKVSADVPAAADVERLVSRFASLRHLSLTPGSRFDWGAFFAARSL